VSALLVLVLVNVAELAGAAERGSACSAGKDAPGGAAWVPPPDYAADSGSGPGPGSHGGFSDDEEDDDEDDYDLRGPGRPKWQVSLGRTRPSCGDRPNDRRAVTARARGTLLWPLPSLLQLFCTLLL